MHVKFKEYGLMWLLVILCCL